MGTANRLRRSGASSLVVLFVSGCTASNDDRDAPPAGGDGAEATSVCAECPVQAGGESSDYGGTPHPCMTFEVRTEVDRERAVELGFDVDQLERRIERPIDAALQWMPADPRGGSAAAGYLTETRISASVRPSDRFTHVGPDPARCDGSACSDPELGEWTCAERLELGVEAELRTLDGAVNAVVSGSVLQGKPGGSFADTPAGSLHSNLRDVYGSLRVFPDPNFTIVEARLMVDLYFMADHTAGDVNPAIVLRSSPASAVHYRPLRGHWPSTPADPVDPPMGGPEP